ncbi:Protein of unknown function [Chitinophaga costaii]|uniref:DUF4230 domain-containing protein n=1 Tax=Chitinophaga costaii TaxID=1335309 RepID=A0A1C4FVV5_9BACT|nr:DUF4230 domain-containing protein [Chitinophaga costaii]PUZ27238.1 DUF4230 domain-containing protein [Chitinophaga costaii]SCC59745.1 Protein of unknown function [Chitinophaga costaii]
MKWFFYTLCLLVLIVAVFWMGKQFGSKHVTEEIVSNSQIVREIAALASLEVQGNATIKTSNIADHNDWSDNLKKAFLENTVFITIPYLAKYGVNIDSAHFRITLQQKTIVVSLPAPSLLSYELKVDKMETANRKGFLLFQDDETYTAVQKKLYITSREQLANNSVYLQQSKDKIRKILTRYYQPFLKDHTLDIQFEDDVGKTGLP